MSLVKNTTMLYFVQKITATDMVVSQKGVPYPVMVPSFPIITTDSRLDYGSKSKLDD